MAVSCVVSHETMVKLGYDQWLLLLGFALEQIDHALEEEEFVLLEFVRALEFELLIDRCQLLHTDFQVSLVKAVGVLAEFVEFG